MRYALCSLRFSKSWGSSSAGRAPESHSGGRRFDPALLHQRNQRVEHIGRPFFLFSAFPKEPLPEDCHTFILEPKNEIRGRS